MATSFVTSFLSRFPVCRQRNILSAPASSNPKSSFVARRERRGVADTFRGVAVMSNSTTPSAPQNPTEGTTSTTTPYVTAYTTVPDDKIADIIINAVVPSRLVACVNVIPGVRSSYWWQGKIENDREMILLMKTRRQNVQAIADALKKVHPYDVPALTVLPIVDGSREFLQWIGESTTASVEGSQKTG